MNRKEREKELRKNEILDVSEKLFMEDGFERTTMDEIAKKSEFSKTTLYKYFKSKNELLFLMHHRDEKMCYEFLILSEKTGDNGAQKFYNYGNLVYKFYKKYPSKLFTRMYLDSTTRELKDISDVARKENQKQIKLDYELIERILSEGKRDGSLRPDLDIDMTIGHFCYTVNPVIKQSLYSTHRFAKLGGKEYYFKYLELFLRGIKS